MELPRDEWIKCNEDYFICKCGGTFGSEEALFMHIKDTHLKYLEIEFRKE